MTKQKSKPKIREVSLAGSGERFVAYVIDAALLNMVSAPITGLLAITLASDEAGQALTQTFFSILLLLIYHALVPLLWNGSTVGKRIINIRIVREDGDPLTLNTLIIRNVLGYMLSSVVLSLGFLAILWNENRQGWHDQFAKTLVVKRK